MVFEMVKATNSTISKGLSGVCKATQLMCPWRLSANGGGQSGIRTHGTRKRTPVFKTGSLNRSDICPG